MTGHSPDTSIYVSRDWIRAMESGEPANANDFTLCPSEVPSTKGSSDTYQDYKREVRAARAAGLFPST